MREISNSLLHLKRPNILVRAARVALNNFQRDATLTRIFGYVPAGPSQDLISDLIEREGQINTQRKSGDVTYNIARHITVLTALISEANSYLSDQRSVT